MSTAGSDRLPAVRRPTLFGAALAGIVVVHLLALAVGSMRPVPDGVLLETILVTALAVGVFLVERTRRATATIVLPYAMVTAAGLGATIAVGLPVAALGVGAAVGLVLYGGHRYALLRLGRLEGSS